MDVNFNDKVLPHNLEAEQAVLGSILLNWESFSEVVLVLKPENFYSIQNQLIYEAMMSLLSQNITGDSLSLMNELTKRNNLEKVGGAAYIASLTDSVPSAANVDFYAQIVLDRYERREMIKISQEMKASAFELNVKSENLIEEAEKKIFALAEKNESTVIHPSGEIMVREIEIIESRYRSKNQFTGIPSGFAKLDTYTSGFQNSELIIIGARPSIGKTALALSMMQYIAVEKHISCGFFSLEMPYEAIGMRILAQEARVNMSKIRSGMLRKDDVTKIQNAAGRWYEAPLYIVDTPNMRLIDLRAMARRMVSKHQVKIIFIDYIGLITTEDSSKATYDQVAEISKSLKALARELQIPVVALSQVARDAEGEEPKLNQIRGSGAVEQDADVVMFLHRDRLKEETAAQDAKIILAKQRNGATGDIKIMFIPSYSKFENAQEE